MEGVQANESGLGTAQTNCYQNLRAKWSTITTQTQNSTAHNPDATQPASKSLQSLPFLLILAQTKGGSPAKAGDAS